MYDRLLESIRRRVEVTSTCWLWQGAHTSGGYSKIWWDGRVKLVHRVIYELLCEAIPPDLVVDHLCRNRGCVNPLHLEIVTNAENIRRGNWKGTGPRTICQRGHALKGENLTSTNRCRLCRLMREKKYREQKK